MPLNKQFPRVPEIHQYRPIVVSSPIVKMLEGFIAPALSHWMETRMVKNQFGFKPKRSIEDCRMFVLTTLT